MRFLVTVQKLNVMDRRTDRQTDRQADGQTDRQTDRRTDGGVAISPVPGATAWREIKKLSGRFGKINILIEKLTPTTTDDDERRRTNRH